MGSILGHPCHLCYHYDAVDPRALKPNPLAPLLVMPDSVLALVKVTYYFQHYDDDLYNALIEVFTDIYGEQLKTLGDNSVPTWLASEGLTSIQIRTKTHNSSSKSGEKTIRISFRYNGEGVKNRIVDHYEGAKKELQ